MILYYTFLIGFRLIPELGKQDEVDYSVRNVAGDSTSALYELGTFSAFLKFHSSRSERILEIHSVASGSGIVRMRRPTCLHNCLVSIDLSQSPQSCKMVLDLMSIVTV
jgi:hypothetical protein